MTQLREQVKLMGTILDLQIYHVNPRPILDEAIARLKMYEQRFSANDDHSELMAINKKAGISPVVVHPELFELIQIGKNYSCLPDSHLNIAIGPLIQTWRIGFDDAKVPSHAQIDELLLLTNPEQIHLDATNRSVYLAVKGMKIDLGCLAKGYIADRIIDYLKSEGVTAALINLGGNLVTFGANPKQADQQWRVGVQNPTKERNQSMIVLKTTNQSVVTSGIYERKLTSNQQTYHHIFNPKTGYPVETQVVSLTIVSKSSCDGEIWTTCLFGKTPTEILATISHLPEIEAIIITDDGQILYSKALEQVIVS